MKCKNAIKAAIAFSALSLASGATFAADCKAPPRTLKPGVLTVAIYNFPPYTTVLGNGQIGGVDSDVVKEIAKKYCMTVAPVVVDPSAVIQNVLTNKVDLGIGDWYRTVERSKVLGLSHPMYIDQMAFYSHQGVSKVSELVGKKIGAVSGFLYAGQLQAVLGDSVTLYPNPVSLSQDLESGRIDVAVNSYGTGVYAKSRGAYQGINIKIAAPDNRVPLTVEPAQIGLLYNKKNPSLGSAIDSALIEMHKTEKIAQILKANGLDGSGAETGSPRLVK